MSDKSRLSGLLASARADSPSGEPPAATPRAGMVRDAKTGHMVPGEVGVSFSGVTPEIRARQLVRYVNAWRAERALASGSASFMREAADTLAAAAAV